MQRGKIVGIAKETIYYDFMHTFYIHIPVRDISIDGNTKYRNDRWYEKF